MHRNNSLRRNLESIRAAPRTQIAAHTALGNALAEPKRHTAALETHRQDAKGNLTLVSRSHCGTQSFQANPMMVTHACKKIEQRNRHPPARQRSIMNPNKFTQ
jgi:hypothetical protein